MEHATNRVCGFTPQGRVSCIVPIEGDAPVEQLAHREFAIYPSLAFAAVAFVMVLLAENARVPVDNPTTHLELTMLHEAQILEYSARHLALVEWAAAIKLVAYMTIGFALFVPWGIAAGSWQAIPLAQ